MADLEMLARVVREHMAGKDYREEAPKIGVHYGTLYNIVRGAQVGQKTLKKVATYFGDNPNDYLEWAGFGRLDNTGESESAFTLVERLLDRAAEAPEEFTYEPDLENFSLKGFPGAENLQPKSLEVAERVMREVLAQERRRQGRE